MEYHLSTTGGTFSDYIFNPENEAKVKEALGDQLWKVNRKMKIFLKIFYRKKVNFNNRF